MEIQGKNLITIDEAIQKYGFSRQFFWSHTSARDVPFYKWGRRIVFDVDELEEWLLERGRVEKV